MGGSEQTPALTQLLRLDRCQLLVASLGRVSALHSFLGVELSYTLNRMLLLLVQV